MKHATITVELDTRLASAWLVAMRLVGRVIGAPLALELAERGVYRLTRYRILGVGGRGGRWRWVGPPA